MVYKNVAIPLQVLSTEHLDASTLSVYFSRPIGFEYEPGDWIDIVFPDEELSGGITYSLSSSPTEPDLAITFRTGNSPFKRRLQTVTPGTAMHITQYGNDYGFHLKDNRSSVLIAGGIGIAPFRSMLREMHDSQTTNAVQLIYMNKGTDYIFETQIKDWAASMAQVSPVFINTKELNRKKRETLLLATIKKDAHHYFIAGPEAMVESTEHLLIDNGVNVKDIRIDSFGGY